MNASDLRDITDGKLREHIVTARRDLSDAELVTKLGEAKEELFNLRFQVATGQLDNNRRLHHVRRDIARIYTVLTERELGIVEDPDANIEEVPAAPVAEKVLRA